MIHRCLAVLCSLMLIFSLCFSACADTADPEGLFSLVSPVTEKDLEIRLQLTASLSDLKANVFAGEEAIASSAQSEGDLLVISLLRPAVAGEALRILLNGTDENGAAQQTELTVTVSPLFGTKLSQLTARAAEMASAWHDVWAPKLADGKVPLPHFGKELPFLTWPDEAPELAVQEEAGTLWFSLSEPVSGEWVLCTGKDMPIVYTDCLYDAERDAWQAAGDFDSVWLMLPETPEHCSIAIQYSPEQEYLAQYPVVEWTDAATDTAFNCYGWGTARAFEGGMFAMMLGEGLMFFAEYDRDHMLTGYTDAIHDLAWNAEDELISGELPEGFQNPVVH